MKYALIDKYTILTILYINMVITLIAVYGNYQNDEHFLLTLGIFTGLGFLPLIISAHKNLPDKFEVKE